MPLTLRSVLTKAAVLPEPPLLVPGASVGVWTPTA
ncbi:hypothetical protein FB388_1785 [Pseudonocardia cypriaca]|uniref:Uncharacterized protein n=1 Tax=Pseudonocardia cypriaca TaxID=882449 RepID=A0A543GEB2_9PSEU|nr:hypothetical protein FB388_1785 [Pseudonocardia cypriaca]